MFLSKNDALVSAGRDKTAIVWAIQNDTHEARRSLIGHSHFISDVTVSEDGDFALTSSWDKTCRLWDLKTGETAYLFQAHTADVLSAAFSPDNRKIVTASRDKTIRIWNTVGECKYVIDRNCHDDWVSDVKVVTSGANQLIFSAGWDKLVKVFNLNTGQIRADLIGHTGYVNTIALSPEGSLCATGGKDGKILLWVVENCSLVATLDAECEIHQIVIHPTEKFLFAATDAGVKVYSLEALQLVNTLIINQLPEHTGRDLPRALSLAWNEDGTNLFVGCTDGSIRHFSQ
ncbi:hypothetical protein RCL1_003519 [Eukaryota sp. TZLM3-RCL]